MIRRPPRFSSLWLTAIAAAGAAFLALALVASWVLRDQIYQTFLDPGVPYQTYEVPPACLLYTSPSPRDVEESRMPSSA